MRPVDRYSFECTGVTIVKGAIPAEIIQVARDLLSANWPSGTPWKFPVLHLGRVFWRMMTHPFLLDASNEFAGENFRVDHVFGVSSNGAKKQLHGGPQSSQNSCFYLPLSTGRAQGLAGQLNFGFAIHGQNEKTGGFCYVPGSHKSVEPRAGSAVLKEIYGSKFDHHSIIVPTLEPGDMILFTEGLVHGDTGWRDKAAQRTQIYYRVTPGFMCWRDPAQMAALSQYAVSDLERRLIEPPWTGRYGETPVSMGVTNERRRPTIEG